MAGCSVIGEGNEPWDTDIPESEAFDADRAAWGPEGRRIAFEHNGPLPDSVAGAPGQLAVNQLWVADLEVGTRRFVHRGPAVAPDWSPDGQQIAFIHRAADGTEEVFLMRSDGTDIRQITQGPGNAERPEWHPEGKAIAFSRQLADGSHRLDLLDVETLEVEPAFPTKPD